MRALKTVPYTNPYIIIFSHDLWEKVVLYTYDIVCDHPYFDFLLFAVLYPYIMYVFYCVLILNPYSL